TSGTFPNEAAPDVFGMQVIGAITRDSADMKLLFSALVGSGAGDPFSYPVHSEMSDRPDGSILPGMRIRYVARMGNHLVDEQVSLATERALAKMVEAGAQIVDGPEISWHQEAWRVLQRAQQASRFGKRLPLIREQLDPSLVTCVE